MLRRIGRILFKGIPQWVWRVFVYAVFGLCLAVGGTILALRYWLLPNLGEHHARIERMLTDATGLNVRIGALEGDWEGLRPQIALRDVRILHQGGSEALVLERVEHILSWLSLVHLEPRFHAIRVYAPHLAVRRDASGRFSVAGIPMREQSEGGGLTDWLLRQREILIRDARIDWVDELLGAQPLSLTGVTLRVYNEGDRHRFGLRAVPPEDIAKPLDVRGDLHGRSVQTLGQWEGTVFVQVDFVDLAAWRQWVHLPVEVGRGVGAVRSWIDLGGGRAKDVIADVRLADVRTRLRPDLPELDLAELSGRIGWRSWSQGFEVSTRQLSAALQGSAAALPVDFHLRRMHADARLPERGELTANVLELGPLAAILDHLPLEDDLRAYVRGFEPRGTVRDLALKWTGLWPFDTWQGRARFEKLGIEPRGAIPGFANVSGTVDATERRGALTLGEQRIVAALPKVFPEPVELDQLAAQVTWTHEAGAYLVRLASVSFANAHLAGTVHGSYQSVAGGAGVIDLTGDLSRADARHVSRYLPLVVRGRTRDWLGAAIVGGQASEVRLRLKGDLEHFPFRNPREGTFQVNVRATNGVLEYARGWPRIEGAVTELTFAGPRMEVRASQASVFGVKLARVRAQIPDLDMPAPVLEVVGDGEGPTSDFLRFIAESPVNAMIGRFTEGMQAQGRGRLALELHIPLADLAASRVNGSYQFASNQIAVDDAFPPLEQVNGRLEFTDSGVRLAGLTTSVFGGQATLSGATQGDGIVRINAQGRANLDVLRKTSPDVPFIGHFSGAADWTGVMTLRNKVPEFVIESGLQGIATDLPVPLSKAAPDTVPLRIERRIVGPQQDVIQVTWGKSVSAHLARRADGRALVVERGAVVLGGGSGAPLPDRPGLVVSGVLPSLDVEQWRAALSDVRRVGESAGPVLLNVDVGVANADVFGRRFHDVTLRGREQSGRWVAALAAREANGEVVWHPQGRGQLVLRMKNLSIPEPQARIGVPGPAAAPDQPKDYPGLDVVVDDFRHKDRALGRLELVAIPEGTDLRIERLRLSNPDAALAADGVWRWNAREPQTRLSVRLDVLDIGRYFARMGYPEGVRGGTARLEGQLGWTGAPQDPDFPTLSGSLMVEANKGQFLKLDPGIGKLLSILSLQALPRRIALDFKDVFSEGFSFDEIIGALKIQRGLVSTDSLRINGSSAKIAMSGDVDLAREMQKLRVRVIPAVGDSVSTVTTLLGGPLAGIGVFLAQKLLNDPFGQLVAHEYIVTGTWADPQVTKAAPAEPARGETSR